MANNGFKNEISKDCPYCKKHLNCSNAIYANHIRWCKLNPKREELDKNTKEKIKKKLTKETKEFEVICEKCGKKFKVIEPIDKFPKKEKYYCSRTCANSRNISNETKEKIKKSINNYLNSSKFTYKKYKHICKFCNKEYINKKKHSIFCSVDCQRNFLKSNSSKSEYQKYRDLCTFKFNLKDYPDEFDFTLIKKYGWYSAKNHGNNLTGVSRDHMISVKYGFENNIDPKIISHPANCKLMIHNENSKKYTKCTITLEELIKRIENWNNKYSLISKDY